MLLESGRLLSSLGTQSTTIAYPLLVLGLTGSAAQAGVVTFARVLPAALLALPGGLIVDRFDRRRLMIVVDLVRAVALASLAAAIVLDGLRFWHVVLVAFVEGACSTVFGPAATAALRSVVPLEGLTAAAGAQQARSAVVNLAGPPLGGALFGIGRALPFAVDAASYLGSIASLLAMRTPFQETREHDRAPLRQQVAEGFRFLWRQPFLRTTAFLYGLTNFIGPGLLLVIVVVGQEQGLSATAIGLLLAVFGGGTVLGALASPLVRRRLSPRAVLLLELWTWLGCAAFVVWPDAIVLAVAIVPSALAIPITDSVVIGLRLAVTPDRLVGRVESVRSTIALAIAPLGPLAAGFLLSATSDRATVGVFAACGLVLALWGTLSPALREPPRPVDGRAPGA